MSNHTVPYLLQAWQNTSQTRGWGAIVAYDRLKCNRLLYQLYIERAGSHKGLFFPELELSTEHTTEMVTNLRLGCPQLSFENANLEQSLAHVTLALKSGLIITHLEVPGMPPRIDKIQKLMPVGGPKLYIELDLANNPGAVGSKGEVILDISDGHKYHATFVVGALDQAAIGERFKVIFEGLSDDYKQFQLGTLMGDLNGPLTPKIFKVRTMPAPGATIKGADNQGDGAVVLLVGMEGYSEGNTPGGAFLYPIPANGASKNYSGCMLLSSQLFMREIVKPQLIEQLKNGIDYSDAGASDTACVLKAVSGAVVLDKDTFLYRIFEIYHKITMSTITFDLTDVHVVEFDGACLVVKVAKTYVVPIEVEVRIRDDYHPEYDATADIEVSVMLRFEAYINANGETSFKESYRNIEVGVVVYPEWNLYHEDIAEFLAQDIRNSVVKAFQENIQLTLADVNTFMVRNLLFPEHNALLLSEAHVTGDLVLFGELDTARTSFSLSPLDPVIQTGAQQIFTPSQPIQNLVWSLTNPDDNGDHKDIDLGTIDNNGRYTAPPSLPEGTRSVVINAQGTLNGKVVKALTMVSVMSHTLAVFPRFQCVSPGRAVTLTAESMGNEPIQWPAESAMGGTLVPTDQGRTCTYTAPASDNSKGPWYLDTVEPTTSTGKGRVELLVLNKNTTFTVSVDSSPAPGQVKLKVEYEGEDVSDLPFIWHKLSEHGALDGRIFTEPPPGEGHDFAVIGVVEDRPLIAPSGFMILPLPLSQHLPAIMRSSELLQKQAQRYSDKS